MERNYTVIESEYTISLDEILPDCVDVPKFLELCKMCPNYGNRWSCPPYTENALSRWMQYDELQLIIRMLKPQAEMTEEQALMAVEREKMVFSDELLKREGEGVISLAAGPCSRCAEDCTRKKHQICRFPHQVRCSIESLGGDVSRLTERYFGKSLLWIQNGKIPEYFLMVGGLLRKNDDLRAAAELKTICEE